MEKAQSKSGILTEKLKVQLKNEHFKDDRQEDGTDVNQEEDGTDVNQEEDGTDDRCNKTEGASLFYDTHEIQELSEGGEVDQDTDLPNFKCEKNPRHTEFVPVNVFNIDHLPEGQRDDDLVELIKATADLTVRVAVKMVSRERPHFWPNTNRPYPFYDKREKDVVMLGTGMVMGVSKWPEKICKEYNEGTCPCNKCQHSDTPSEARGMVRMHTARHVVFDDLEARHTTCRLFFDKQDSQLVTLDGLRVLEADIKDDWCEFECVTCDVGLLDTLIKMADHWYDLWMKIRNKYESSRDEVNMTFIVSHPHGCPKHISVGQWIDRREVRKNRTKYTYTTCTCKGSSGAHVYSLGYDGLTYDRHVHGGAKPGRINYSGTGRHWSYYRHIF